MPPLRRLVLLLALLLGIPSTATAQSSEPYVWKNVQMVGGGFVPGVVFHPTEPGLRYARTDMGGAYRWDDAARRWVPLLDGLSYDERNLMGVESIAVDPHAPDRVYLAAGTYTRPQAPRGAILRSDDRGRTWQHTDVPFKMGGNENGRGNGERMAVDPNDGGVLYLGTRHAGLWKSTDRAASWHRVATFPDVGETPPPGLTERERRRWMWRHQGSGIVFVVFDSTSGARGRGSQTIYVGASLMGRDNLFRSTDGGATWTPVPGHPQAYRPNHGVLASDGTLYVSYGDSPGPTPMTDGGVWKLGTETGAWTEITPDDPDPEAGRAFGYAAVAVDARDPQALLATSFGRHDDGGEDVFRSIDGGTTWTPLFGSGGTFDHSAAPYVARTGLHWMFDVEIDPFDPDHALFVTGYGGHETFNLTAADEGEPTTWHVMSTGIEETVALDLLSPPEGAALVTAIGDYGGFVHWDLDHPAPAGNFTNPHFGNTDDLALAADEPRLIVRVGVASHQRPDGANIGYTMDGGRTWQPAGMPTPDSRHGHVAVSADGTSWIWTPEDRRPYVTHDRGARWTRLDALPEDTRVVADRANPQVFYAMALFDGRLFTSRDGGRTFAEQPLRLPHGLPEPARERGDRGDVRGGQDRLYAAPDREGDLWLAAFDGLYRSTDAGSSFARLGGVDEIHAFGFGKAAPESDYPALFLVGTVRGTRGIFRSDDAAQSWVRINDDAHEWGLVLHITGDPKRYRRAYVGTHGRGTFYGE